MTSSNNVCKLCEITGGDDPIIHEMLAYVTESADSVPLDEICRQVKESLKVRLDIEMSTKKVKEHFLSHRCEQSVVLNYVLRDLVDILAVSKSNCIVVSEETGVQGMDAKNTNVYLDTIKQIMSVYKQIEVSGKRKRGVL